MFDVNGYIRPYIDEVKPHAAGAMLEMRAFGHRIVEVLCEIAENTRDEPFISDRLWPTVNLVTAGDQAGKELFTVPANEDWEIEHVRVGADAGGNVQLTTFRASAPSDPALVRVGTAAFPTGLGNVNGVGVIVPGGVTVYAAYGGAAATNITVTAQVRRKYRKPAKRGTYSPYEVPTDGDESTPNNEPARHHGTWTPREVSAGDE
jgi:hypothetical protein